MRLASHRLVYFFIWIWVGSWLSAQGTLFFGCAGHAVDAQLNGDVLTHESTLRFPLGTYPRNQSVLDRFQGERALPGLTFDGQKVKVNIEKVQEPGYGIPLFIGKATFPDGTVHSLDGVFFWTGQDNFSYRPTLPTQVSRSLLARLKQHTNKMVAELIRGVIHRRPGKRMGTARIRSVVAPQGRPDLARIQVGCPTDVLLTSLYRDDSIDPGFVNFVYLVDLQNGTIIFEDWAKSSEPVDSNFMFLHLGTRLYYVAGFQCADGEGTHLLDLTNKVPINPERELNNGCYPAE